MSLPNTTDTVTASISYAEVADQLGLSRTDVAAAVANQAFTTTSNGFISRDDYEYKLDALGGEESLRRHINKADKDARYTQGTISCVIIAVMLGAVSALYLLSNTTGH